MGEVRLQLGRYDLLEEVGRGGMAVVYRGRDRTLDREVAVKVLHSHLASSPESRARFQQEARSVAKLRHRNIIEIYDFESGEGPSDAFIVTEFIAGKTLRAFIDEHKVHFPEVAALIGLEMCAAIGHAHALGIIHRDLKPENMMITLSGELKLMDFGIAKVIDQQEQLTMTGSLLGSPAHMAPEMLEGRELDVRSDLFSVGTILYWLSCGQLPFTGKNPHQVLRSIIEGRFPDPAQLNPEVGADLARLLRRALARDPAERFGSALELGGALEDLLRPLGLGDARAELARFFADPASFVADLRPRVEASLLTRAKEAIEGRLHRQALEALDRLLAMHPGHTEATELVRGLARRGRRGRILRRLGITAAALVLVGGAALGVRALLGEPPAPIPPPAAPPRIEPLERPAAAALPATEPPATEPPTTALPTAAPAAEAPSAVVGPERPPPPLASKPVGQAVTIRVKPYFDSLYIDQKLAAKRGGEENNYGQVQVARLKPGRHKVRVQNEFCVDLEEDIIVPERPLSPAELDYPFKLAYKPANLEVSSGLNGVGVFVDDRFRGTLQGGERKRILIPIEGKTSDREGFPVQLRLTGPEAREVTKLLHVNPGQLLPIEVKAEDFAKRGLRPQQNSENRRAARRFSDEVDQSQGEAP